MQEAFEFIFEFIGNCVYMLDGLKLGSFFWFDLSFFDVIVGCLVLGMFISVFWKGAKT